MRIGIDIRTLMDREYSGVSLHTLNLVREILKLDRENKYILFYNLSRDIKEKMPKFEGENVKVVSTRYPNKIFNYLMQKIFSWPKIDKMIGQVDLFFSPHVNFASLSRDCKKVLIIHDLSFLKYPEFFSQRKRLWHNILNVKKMIREADSIVAISKNTKRDIIDLCQAEESKVKVIYPGISSEFKVLDRDDQRLKGVKEKYSLPDKFILYLGTIEPRKNIQGIIRAFDEISSRIGDCQLIIAGGRGWKNSPVFNAQRKAKNKDKIKFLGYVSEKEKVCFYNLASLFVFPSFYEGFGFPPLEAQASGAPVIAGDVSSLPEALGASALLVDSDNIGALSVSMEEVLNDNNLKNYLIEKGLENAERFNWQNAAKEYLNVFRKLK